MKKLLIAGVAAGPLSLCLAVSANAQSTGSIDSETVIVVKGKLESPGISGVIIPDTAKAKQVLTQEVISAQSPGQTINDTINLVPGVSFQNNDPFGSAGGTLNIRGFDNTRISQTFDGLPLNDTGNYALYSNQQLDPELIEEVNVNLGSTDIDSPTASASGSTVNYRTRKPYEDFGVRMQGSAGSYDFMRVFGSVDTGRLTSSGLRAFVAASKSTNNAVYGGIGKINKTQLNGRIYQPLGDNGDFISLSANYNRNINNFFGSYALNTFPVSRAAITNITPCQIPAGVFGVANVASACGSAFEYRYNPSKTGNVRANMRFTLSDNLVLSIDPSVQFVSANGGGTVDAREGGFTIGTTRYAGYFGGKPYFNGVDLNGDGDVLDVVRIVAPSQTKTTRYGLNTSLRYDINDNNMLRFSYTLDYGRHRQTGETGLLLSNGFAANPFPVEKPLTAADGTVVQKRDRKSLAILNQIGFQYRGRFGSNLTVDGGVRIPFMERKLENFCFTSSASGNVDCPSSAASAAYATANPSYGRPGKANYKYSRVLPSLGLTYKVGSNSSIFGSYSEGIQVPGTDYLYQFYWPTLAGQKPVPETTRNFDLGIRTRAGKFQGEIGGWATIYDNRLASSFDIATSTTLYRNLGRVNKYGFDGKISWQPVDQFSLYVYGSMLKSKIKNDVVIGLTCATGTSAWCYNSGGNAYAMTAGRSEAGAPTYTYGARAEGTLGPVRLGGQVKRTGPRYFNDLNLPVTINTAGTLSNKTPAYTLVDLDAKVSLEGLGLNNKTYFQLNVTNLFNELYYGGFSGNGTSPSSTFTTQLGAPRAIIGTVNFQF